ncbi:hypothetical protein ACFUN8_05845 [Streptomyces sp. NPDC057307]|uniref:hypothetical protein n=1 Tax=Streptomyces sp. NPDC057307 TaxID=3346096 RepID=UPI003638BCCE
MVMDYAARRQARNAAKELLEERYNEGEYSVDPVPAMRAVRAAAYGYVAREGEPAPEVPPEDVLAALPMMDIARAQLDALEHEPLRTARSRGASWSTVAGALGLSSGSPQKAGRCARGGHRRPPAAGISQLSAPTATVSGTPAHGVRSTRTGSAPSASGSSTPPRRDPS